LSKFSSETPQFVAQLAKVSTGGYWSGSGRTCAPFAQRGRTWRPDAVGGWRTLLGEGKKFSVWSRVVVVVLVVEISSNNSVHSSRNKVVVVE